MILKFLVLGEGIILEAQIKTAPQAFAKWLRHSPGKPGFYVKAARNQSLVRSPDPPPLFNVAPCYFD